MEYLEEILAHAATQPEGENLVAVGGMHTSGALQNVIAIIESPDDECSNPELTHIPDAWLKWPVIGDFFEDELPNHWQELLALGNIDNESLALEVSFRDRLLKLRDLENTFGSVNEYKSLAAQSQARK